MANSLWKNKLLAWLHAPAENSLVLFNDPCGCGKEIFKDIIKELEIDQDSDEIKHEIEFADLLASSADRPQWPREENGSYVKWSRVDFNSEPILVHPLTGDKLQLRDLTSTDFSKINKACKESFQHLLSLGIDAKMKFLALWRFAPEYRESLGLIWNLLPADTRVPDYSIWNHLDLTSAFIGARTESKKMSVLNMAFGPVQSFIAQARATSDLWAGSHLLSSMVWEGMKVIADEIGPDAFIFPQIRGLAIVDAWLLEKAKQVGDEYEKLWKNEFERIGVDWLKDNTDSNPLFAACLPNKFSAIVPSDRALDLAEKIKQKVRGAIKEWCVEALELLEWGNSAEMQKQLEAQLAEFPQVFISSVEWGEDAANKTEDLQNACSVFSDASDNFFNGDYWNSLKNEIEISGNEFWKINAGIVYPAIYELADKSLAANKSLRDFKQMPQVGFRCTLCGEREWLTTDRKMLLKSPGSRKDSNWNDLKDINYKHEHLCAICTLKRFWPKVFINKIRSFIDKNIGRYGISTHTMSLIPTMTALVRKANSSDLDLEKVKSICREKGSFVALPRRMNLSLGKELKSICKAIPAYVDFLRECGQPKDYIEVENFYNQLRKITGVKPETYYALILMDGDNMGAWLSSNEKERQIPFSATWHPEIIESPEFDCIRSNNKRVNVYLNTLKSASPTRHASISQALNNFSSKIVPDIIENKNDGKLIYSGGDDVLAMAPTDQVISIIEALRMAYSGFGNNISQDEALENVSEYKQKGFIIHNGRLLQTMGLKATASVGVVIVHHQTPLAYALKCLREAEHMAKNAGRNAFCIRILKRAGGEISFTDSWWSSTDGNYHDEIKEKGFTCNSSIGLFGCLVKLIAKNKEMSRRALYAVEEWINLLPEWSDNDGNTGWTEAEWETSKSMASAMLGRQFAQHSPTELKSEAKSLAENVIDFIWRKAKFETNKSIRNPMKQLQDMLFCAEFFARETRSFNNIDALEAENE